MRSAAVAVGAIPGAHASRTGTLDRLTRMALIQELDFIGIPSRDAERARSFYRDVLGMRPDEHAEYEQWAGSTCFVIWEPEKQGMPFVPQKGLRISAEDGFSTGPIDAPAVDPQLVCRVAVGIAGEDRVCQRARDKFLTGLSGSKEL